MPKGLNDRLQDLKNLYCQQLPDRMLDIGHSIRDLGDDRRDAAGRLRVQSHKIAGSAGIFGFDAVTATARKLENASVAFLEAESEPSDASRAELQTLAEELREACERAADGRENATTNELQEERRIALVTPERTAELEDLVEQLSMFRYAVKFLGSFDELRIFAETSPGGLALVHTNLLADQDEFEKLKRQLGDLFHFVFLSERTDYLARLTALRAGGEAYFVLPLDIGRLLESIESLIGVTEKKPYHVLIVDDDPDQISYYALVLQQAGMITSVASDPRTVLDILSEAKPELILMDMYMPECSGAELISMIRQQEAFVGVPVVFLSVEDGTDRKIDAIRLGGDDFLTKPVAPAYLIASVENRIARTRSIRFFMERDSLTGLLNHSNLREQLIREIMRARRSGATLCYAMIDLDKFKQVNDTHGHLTGDRVLKSLSRMLQDSLRRTDIIGRYGGEEFGAVLINTDEAVAVGVLDKIRENFGRVRHQGERSAFYLTFSCGIACLRPESDIDMLTQSADDALYRAKSLGRNRVVRAPEPGA